MPETVIDAKGRKMLRCQGCAKLRTGLNGCGRCNAYLCNVCYRAHTHEEPADGA